MALDIATLDGQNGFITVGTGPDGRDVHGISISGLGDVNGDGLDDFVIGSDGGDFFPPDLAGRSHVIFGTEDGFPEFLDLTTLEDFTGDNDVGFTIFGPQTWAQAGFAVGAAGDLNSDGYMDIVIGAPNDDVRFYGIDVDVVVKRTEIVEGEEVEVTETVTVTLNDDLRKAEGAAYVVYGQESFDDAVFLASRQGAVVRKFDGVVLTPVEDVQYSLNPNFFDDEEVTQDDFYFDPKGLFFGEQVGYSVGTRGDVNGDGYDDLIVGAKGDFFTPGDTWIVFGGPEPVDDLSGNDVDGVNLVQFRGTKGNSQAGSATSLVDLNGDNISDIVIGANEFDNSFNNSNEGRTYIIFGSSDPAYFKQKNGSFSVDDIGGPLDGIRITGRPGTLSGEVVNNAGDVNGDGIDDLLIGSPGSNGFHFPGSPGYNPPDSYIIWGRNDGGLRDINLNSLSPVDGVRITKGDNFNMGRNVVDYSHEYGDTAGDVNGDGYDDIIIGTNQKTSGPGYATVLYGGPDFGGPNGLVVADDAVNGTGGFRIVTTDQKPFNTLNFNGTNTNFGASVGGLGDINGDGVDDVAVGSPAFTGLIDGTPVTEDAIQDTLRERGKTSIVFGVRIDDIEDVTAAGFNDVNSETITVTIELTNPALNTITLDWATLDGTAKGGSGPGLGDFRSDSGSLTFQTGETRKEIELTIFRNDFTENDETFTLALTNALGAGFGNSRTENVTVTIQSLPNEKPVAGPDTAILAEDGSVSGNVAGNDSDVDGDPLTFELKDGPSDGSATVDGSGDFEYTPDPNFNGTDSFTYRVDDGKGGIDTGTVTVTVTPVNDAPIARDDNFQIEEDETLSDDVTDNHGFGEDFDLENDPITWQLKDGPANGSVIFNTDGTFDYTPDADFNGTDTFTYTVSDGLLTSTATVSVLVNPVQDAPVARDDMFSVQQGDYFFGSVLADNGLGADGDPDGDRLRTTLDQGPANGTVLLLQGGIFLYEAEGDYFGTDTFSYTLHDGEGNSSQATVTVDVQTNENRFSVVTPDGTVLEGDDGDVTSFTFEVERTGRVDLTGSVNYQLTGVGLNPAGADDLLGGLASGTLNFAAGETSRTVTIQITGDLAPENVETLQFSLSNPAAGGGSAAVIVDGAAVLEISDTDIADVVGTSGNDKLSGDDGDNVIFAGRGNDRLDGNNGDDVLLGGDGDDRLDGGGDDDTLNGGEGNDRLDGGDGDDILIAGPGNDEVKGGPGDDIFVYRPGDDLVRIDDFDPDEDLIDISAFGEAFDTLFEIFSVGMQDGKDAVFDFGNGDVLTIRKTSISELNDMDHFIIVG